MIIKIRIQYGQNSWINADTKKQYHPCRGGLKKGFSASLSNQGRKAFNMGQLWWKLARQTEGDKGECVDKDFLIKKSTYAVSSSKVGESICFVMASPL